MSLAIIETHPVQYHAPVYRALQQRFGIPVTAIYASDFSVKGYRDKEFGTSFAWESDLVSGYSTVFLSRVEEGGAASAEEVTSDGLQQALRKAQPDVVMLLGYSPRFNRDAVFAALGSRRPILFRAETTDHALARGPVKNWVRRRALRWFYSRCAKQLYIGRRSRDHYLNHGCRADSLVFSPYCVDTTPFRCDEAARGELRAATRAALGVGEQKILLVFSGKLSARKGPDLLLDAVKQMPAAIRDRIELMFLGGGELQNSLQERARAVPEIPSHFLGFKQQAELSQYYHAADALVLPSRVSETWGLVVNDAMHHGLPCIVSDAVGCAPDLIENDVTGRVFLNGSAADLAKAIEAVALLAREDSTRRVCRDRIAAYSTERAAAGIAEAYRSVTKAA